MTGAPATYVRVFRHPGVAPLLIGTLLARLGGQMLMLTLLL